MSEAKVMSQQVGLEKRGDFLFRSGIIFLTGLIAFVVYIRASGAGFIGDDRYLIIDNPKVRGEFSLSGIIGSQFWSGTEDRSVYYRPLVSLSYALEYRLFSGSAFGYHLVNIIYHIFCSVFVFLCFYYFIRGLRVDEKKARRISWLSGMIFAVHPAHTQSVVWISGRTDLLATFFSLLSFYLYIRAKNLRAWHKVVMIIFSLFSFFLSLLSKEISAIFPLIVVLADFIAERNLKILFKAEKLVLYLAFAGVLVGYLLIRRKVFGFAFGYGHLWEFYWYYEGGNDFSRVVSVFKVLFYYLRTLLYPVHLCFECRLLPSFSWSDPEALLSIIFVSLILASAIYDLRHLRFFGFGIFWFFFGLLPVANIIPMPELAMEHFLYFPSAGFCLAMAVILTEVFEYRSRLSWMLIGFLLVFYSGLCFERISFWKDDKTLLLDSLKKAPLKSRSNSNLGVIYVREGNYRLASLSFKRAVLLQPSDQMAHYNLGAVYYYLGEFDSAIEQFNEVIRLNPERADAHNSLGNCHLRKGQYENAIKEFRLALELDPNFFMASNNLGKAYLVLGNCASAWEIYNQLGEKTSADFVEKLYKKCPK